MQYNYYSAYCQLKQVFQIVVVFVSLLTAKQFQMQLFHF